MDKTLAATLGITSIIFFPLAIGLVFIPLKPWAYVTILGIVCYATFTITATLLLLKEKNNERDKV